MTTQVDVAAAHEVDIGKISLVQSSLCNKKSPKLLGSGDFTLLTTLLRCFGKLFHLVSQVHSKHLV